MQVIESRKNAIQAQLELEQKVFTQVLVVEEEVVVEIMEKCEMDVWAGE